MTQERDPLANVRAGMARRGRHHVYLGMAPGVGKTYAMLLEARRLAAEGRDVVVGFVETHGRRGTAEAMGDLEVLPRRVFLRAGRELEELDTPAVLARRPEVVLIDELAHTNTPGSEREKRWQDVQVVLSAGIDVMSTVNIQHFDSVAPLVEAITGAPVRERLPDRIIEEADRVELIDIAPEALRQRLASGAVYPRERAEQALREFFREGNLTALRELALRRLSTAVERNLEAYMREHAIDAPWAASERVLAVADGEDGDDVVRHAARLARLLHAELLVASLGPAPEEHERLATDLGAMQTHRIDRAHVESLRALVNDMNVGHVVMRAPERVGLREVVAPSTSTRVLALRLPVPVHLVPAGG